MQFINQRSPHCAQANFVARLRLLKLVVDLCKQYSDQCGRQLGRQLRAPQRAGPIFGCVIDQSSFGPFLDEELQNRAVDDPQKDTRSKRVRAFHTQVWLTGVPVYRYNGTGTANNGISYTKAEDQELVRRIWGLAEHDASRTVIENVDLHKSHLPDSYIRC